MSEEQNYIPFPPIHAWVEETIEFSADAVQTAVEGMRDVALPVREAAVKAVRDAAAIETGAIEKLYELDRGITITAAVQSAQLEAALAKHDQRARSLIAAQMAAYDFVLDLVTGGRPIAQAWIRELHTQICSAQETYKALTSAGELVDRPLTLGGYKNEPNHVRTVAGPIHHYAPVRETESEMARLVNELRSDAFMAAHPVDQISYAHYALVAVHPFTDGNGRVARAFASIFSYKRYTVPLLITADQRPQYFSALAEADRGVFGPFRRFIGSRVTQSIRLMITSIKAAQLGSVEHRINALKKVYETRGGYLQVDIDETAHVLLNDVKRQLEEKVEEHRKSFSGLHISVGDAQADRDIISPNHRRALRYGPRLVRLQGTSHSPGEANVITDIGIEVPRDAARGDVFRVVSGRGFPELELLVEEVLPERGVFADVQISLFVSSVVAATLEALEQASRLSMGQKGYSVNH